MGPEKHHKKKEHTIKDWKIMTVFCWYISVRNVKSKGW